MSRLEEKSNSFLVTELFTTKGCVIEHKVARVFHKTRRKTRKTLESDIPEIKMEIIKPKKPYQISVNIVLLNWNQSKRF